MLGMLVATRSLNECRIELLQVGEARWLSPPVMPFRLLRNGAWGTCRHVQLLGKQACLPTIVLP